MLRAREDTMNPAVVIADLEFAILERESEISISLSDFSSREVSPAREVDCAELSLRNRRDRLLALHIQEGCLPGASSLIV